ncbi:MAG: S-layer homology domain-containing protein, partial [Bacillota bacterium]|nr:S-layer homology domain-containing protein [Bacillota bacterium]
LLNYMSTKMDMLTARGTKGMLGEFDYTNDSGWMITVNNEFIGSSSSDRVLKNGEVIRWQFTLCGYGVDLGANNTGWGDDTIILTAANKDELTAKVAEANALSGNPSVKNSNAYKSAVNLLQNMESTQVDVDKATSALEAYLTNGTDTESVTQLNVKYTTLEPGAEVYKYDPDYVAVTGITLDKNAVTMEVGEKVSLTENVTPEDAKLKTVKWESDNAEVAKVSSGGKITALKPGAAKITAATVDGGYTAVCNVTVAGDIAPEIDVNVMTDVKEADWFYDDVAFVLAKGIMKGTSDKEFAPKASVTRGQFVTILGRWAGVEDSHSSAPAQTKFSDVEADKYYASHVAWAVENNVTNGTSATTFSPNENITRQDMATMIARYAESVNIALPAGSGDLFADDSEIRDYAKKAVYSMKAAGIINGKGDNKFVPEDNALRAEAAKIIHKLMEL